MKQYIHTRQELEATRAEDRWKFYIAREYFTSIPIVETGEKLVQEDYLNRLGIKIEPIWEGTTLDEEGLAYKEYLATHILKGWMRLAVADRLAKVSVTLQEQGLVLVLKAGFRPLEVQKRLFQDVLDSFRPKYPTLSETELIEMTRDYVSDPSQLSPPHTVGAAVDVMIKTISGTAIDMGCEVNQGEDIAWSNYERLTVEQKNNRSILRDAMIGAGFAPLGSEWWHFSFGDQIWAAYYDQPTALYGIYDK